MKRKKVAILGASGYTGSDLIRFLLMHPQVEIAYLTADRHSGKRISDVFPNLRGLIDLELQPLDPGSIPRDVDIVFCALPHGKSASIVEQLFPRSIHIIDLGADFRLSYENYKKWYGEHPCPDLISEAVYGITELKKSDISRAKLVANPGCYPESAILGLAPLIKDKLIDEESIIVDSKSGVSGAGRSPELSYLFCEVNEGVKAYKVGEHRHTPEINEFLSEYAGSEVSVSFTPHLVPMDRGILSTIYVKLRNELESPELLEIYDKFYGDKKFIRIRNENEFPSTGEVKGSNFCDIGIKSDPLKKTAIIVSAIDNLVKGASGQAVQNMNVMMELDESTGLDVPPLFP